MKKNRLASMILAGTIMLNSTGCTILERKEEGNDSALSTFDGCDEIEDFDIDDDEIILKDIDIKSNISLDNNELIDEASLKETIKEDDTANLNEEIGADVVLEPQVSENVSEELSVSEDVIINNEHITLDDVGVIVEEGMTSENKEQVLEEQNKEEIIEIHNFAYLLKDSLLYYDINELSNNMNIEAYQKVFIVSEDSEYSYVQYSSSFDSEPICGYINKNDLEMLPDLYVEVDISDQMIRLYKDTEVITSNLVVTGANGTPTRIGCFPIYYKQYDTHLKGSGYDVHVDYWMPFDGGIGLHDADWRYQFGGDIYVYGGSHGCVNMPKETAKVIYENVEANDKVLVHK